jgi:hypothetical protein
MNTFDDELRSLIFDYITAYNNGSYSLAEEILFKIKQMREQDESHD